MIHFNIWGWFILATAWTAAVVLALNLHRVDRLVKKEHAREVERNFLAGSIAILEEEVLYCSLEQIVKWAEEKAEEDYRREIVANAREDFVYGIGRYGQPDS